MCICSCVVLLLLCLDWEGKTQWCYSLRKGVHFTERALLKPKTSSGGRSVKHLPPRAGDAAADAALVQNAGPSTASPDGMNGALSVLAHASACFCLCPRACLALRGWFVCDQHRVPLSCRARWCAGLWAASLLPSPGLPAPTHRPCWHTPSPWLRTPSAPKSSSMCLTRRRSEQVRGPPCQGSTREGAGVKFLSPR